MRLRANLLVSVACLALVLPLLGRGQRPAAEDKSEPAKGRQARADRYGDPLPEGAIARLGTIRLRQPDSEIITSVTFSPDGKVVASAGGDTWWEGMVHEAPYRIR